MITRRSPEPAPPRPPFWVASVALHAALVGGLVVWGTGSGRPLPALRPAEISAEVDYTEDEEVPAEELEEPTVPEWIAENPFSEPPRAPDEWELEEEIPHDYLLPRVAIPPLEWTREAIIRPLPGREEPTDEIAPTKEPIPPSIKPAPAEPKREAAPIPPPRKKGRTSTARPDANRSPAPQYPRRARRRGLEGRVVLLVEINERGEPTRITVSKSSGHSALDGAAVEALWKWRFIPAYEDGRAVTSVRHQSFRFALR